MRKPVALSIGDNWEYEKAFPGEELRLSSEFTIIGREKVGGLDCWVIDWHDETVRGGRRLVGGRYWIESQTERFVRAERTFYDGSGKILQTETFERPRLLNWGIRGRARLLEPLKIGEGWSFEDLGSTNQVSVVERGRVEGTAGEFDCYVIETKVLDTRLKFAFRSWYSRRLGIIVKSTACDSAGRVMGITELTRYDLSQEPPD